MTSVPALPHFDERPAVDPVPASGPLQNRPGRIRPVGVPAQRTMTPELPGEELRCGSEPGDERYRGQRRHQQRPPMTRPHVRPDRVVPLAH